MAKLLMITGRGSAADLASGKKGAFYNTLKEFHKYWERVDIICPKVRSNKLKVIKIFENVYIFPSPWSLIFQPWWILKKGSELNREQKFDLVTVHEYPPFYNGIGARMLWNKIKVSYVLEIFHIPGYPKAANLKERLYKKLFYFFIGFDCQRAKAVRVMNSQVSAKLAGLGVPESKIKLISAIYIDLDVFKPMSLEKRYDLIFVGRLVKNKGVELLIDAGSKLKIKNPNFKLLIVGEGPLKKKLEVRSEKLGLQGNISFYGWARDNQEIARLLNQSKVLVMPSYNEGGPRVVAEAMACGLSILATSVGIVADIMKNTQLGQIIKWETKDIAEKANQLITNESMYQKYSETGLATAGQFEKKSAIRSYAEKLKELSTSVIFFFLL